MTMSSVLTASLTTVHVPYNGGAPALLSSVTLRGDTLHFAES